MTDPNWKTESLRLIDAIDPHRRHRPVYLLTANEAADVLHLGRTAAMTSVFLPIRLRPLLERRGDWRGYGFAAVFADWLVGDSIAITAAVLHEYTHQAENPPAIVNKLADIDAAPPPLSKPLAAPAVDNQRHRFHHGAQFIRLLLHATFRAWRFGFRVYPHTCFDPRSDGRGDIYEYNDALANEPQRLLDIPLSAVSILDLPAEYTQFAADDERRARRGDSPPTHEVSKNDRSTGSSRRARAIA